MSHQLFFRRDPNTGTLSALRGSRHEGKLAILLGTIDLFHIVQHLSLGDYPVLFSNVAESFKRTPHTEYAADAGLYAAAAKRSVTVVVLHHI